MKKTINLEATQVINRNFQIEIPSYYKNACSSWTDYRAILDEKTYCEVSEGDWRTYVQNCDLMQNNKSQLSEAASSWERITEQEFLTAYNRALHSMSLTPELVNNEPTEQDEQLNHEFINQ